MQHKQCIKKHTKNLGLPRRNGIFCNQDLVANSPLTWHHNQAKRRIIHEPKQKPKANGKRFEGNLRILQSDKTVQIKTTTLKNLAKDMKKLTRLDSNRMDYICRPKTQQPLQV